MPSKTIFSAFLALGLWVFGYCDAPQEKCAMLLEAVRKDELKQVLQLLERGLDVNCRGEHNYTPIIVAAKYDRVEIAKALCEKGADISALADSDEMEREMGFTPLLWSAWNCSTDMANLLISHGAAAGQKGRQGDTPLIIAARKNCLPLVKMLITNGAFIDDCSEINGDTALIEAVSQGFLDLANYLIEQGANIMRKDQAGRSLLALAAFRGHPAEVRYFYEKGIPVDGRDRLGQTAMHYVVNDRAESCYILDYLISHEGEISIKSKDGTSPLMIASQNGANIAVKVLISNGAAVNDANVLKETPLQLACRGIGDLATNQETKKRETTIRSLLAARAQVNTQDNRGKTPLMEAARNPYPQIVKDLLDHGAQLDVQDSDGWTALMYAADRNQTAVIKVLARRGADLNLKNARGNTALSIAKAKDSSAEAYALLKSLSGIGPGIRNSRGSEQEDSGRLW